MLGSTIVLSWFSDKESEPPSVKVTFFKVTWIVRSREGTQSLQHGLHGSHQGHLLPGQNIQLQMQDSPERAIGCSVSLHPWITGMSRMLWQLEMDMWYEHEINLCGVWSLRFWDSLLLRHNSA